jgi:hypothetical protein
VAWQAEAFEVCEVEGGYFGYQALFYAEDVDAEGVEG